MTKLTNYLKLGPQYFIFILNCLATLFAFMSALTLNPRIKASLDDAKATLGLFKILNNG